MRKCSTSEPAQSKTAPSPSRNSRLLDLRTAADYIGCSYWDTLGPRDLVLNGHVPAVRISCPRAKDGRALRRILIDVRDIDRLIESWKEVNHADITPRPGGASRVRSCRSSGATSNFEARVVRLDPHTTKNDEGRTFPFTDALERLLRAQKAEHERLRGEGVLCPWVFNRSTGAVKGRRITTFIKAFKAA